MGRAVSVVLLCGLWASSASAAHPAYGKDLSVVSRKIQETLKDLAKGLPHDELPPMDPVSMVDISFSRGYGPVRADMFFPTSTLSGVSAVDEVSSIQCTGDSTLAFLTRHPSIVQQGKYNLTGNFASVFATGKGLAHIQLMDVTIQHSLRWRCTHDGYRVREYRGAVRPGGMKVHYSNLRSATRDVMAAECQQSSLHMDVNKYFNDNWRTLYEAISPSVDYAFSAVFRDYMDALLQAVGPDIHEACDAVFFGTSSP